MSDDRESPLRRLSDAARRHRTALAVAVGGGLVGAGWLVLDLAGTGRLAPAPPEITADPVDPYVQPISVLDVPIRIGLGVLVEEVERRVPTEWGTIDSLIPLPERGRTRAEVALWRTPFRGSVTGTTAQLATTIFYALRASYSLPVLPDVGMSCGIDPDDPQPRLSVALEAPIGLTSGWSLNASTRVVRVAPLTANDEDRCEVTFAGFDVTESVVEAAHDYLDAHTSTIDSIVAAADVRSSFEGWWRTLYEPIPMGPDVWLDLRPSGIRRGEIRGSAEEVVVHASLEARPRVVFGARPEVTAVPLPPLAEGAADGDLEVLVEALAEYGEVNRLLNEAARGTSVMAGQRRLDVTSLSLLGVGGGRVALAVDVQGDVRGTLFLVGTPTYDPADGHVSVPDLQLSVSTSDILAAGASWIFESGIEAELQERARWPVDFAVSWAEDELETGLNSTLAPGVHLSGRIDRVRVSDVLATTRGLLVRAHASGRAALIVED